MASMKLKGEVEEVSHLQSVLDDLETLVTVIKAKRSDLRDVQGRLRDQIRLCQEEIGLGSHWGSKPPPGVQIDLDNDSEAQQRTTLRDLQDIFSGPQVVVENVETDSSLESLLEDSMTSDSADEFLDAIEDAIEIAPRESSLDIDSLLKDFDL
jgi:hypothetical protein